LLDGTKIGENDGFDVGYIVWVFEGVSVSLSDGENDGRNEGSADGILEGIIVGNEDGITVSLVVGLNVGLDTGAFVGLDVKVIVLTRLGIKSYANTQIRNSQCEIMISQSCDKSNMSTAVCFMNVNAP
jgi:hypothetical protein